jgi:hypothetical protein
VGGEDLPAGRQAPPTADAPVGVSTNRRQFGIHPRQSVIHFFIVGVRAQSHTTLHQKAIVVDTHNDVLSSATIRGLNIENDLTGKTHSDIAHFKTGGIDVQVF